MRPIEFALAKGKLLSEVIEPYWKVLDYSHIWTSQYLFDGRYIDVCSRPSWRKKMAEERWYDLCAHQLYPNLSRSNSPIYSTWSCDDFKGVAVFDAIKQVDGVASGHNFYIVHETGIESIGIATHHPRPVLSRLLIEYEAQFATGVAFLRKFLREELGKRDCYESLERKWERPFDNAKLQASSWRFPIRLCGIENQLTYRQMQVLGLLAQGQTYKGIAKILHLSPRTIEHCAQNIRDEFGGETLSTLTRDFHIHGYFDLLKFIYDSK